MRAPAHLLAAAATFAMSCAHCSRYPESKMLPLAAALTKLTAACEGTLQFGENAADLDGDALLHAATHDDPSLLGPFSGWVIKVVNVDHHAVVLLCDGLDRGVLEDVGCTGKPDAHHWQHKELPGCRVTLDVRAACADPPEKDPPAE